MSERNTTDPFHVTRVAVSVFPAGCSREECHHLRRCALGRGALAVAVQQVVLCLSVYQLSPTFLPLAGTHADKVAGLADGEKNPKILAFRGTYYQSARESPSCVRPEGGGAINRPHTSPCALAVKPEFRNIVTRNIYPIPSGGGIPVGVHFTPTVHACAPPPLSTARGPVLLYETLPEALICVCMQCR